MSPIFSRRTTIDAPAADVFRFHTRPQALERLTPPWMRMRVLERHGGITPGSRVVLDAPAGPFRARWVMEHRDYVEGKRFRDVQLSGPFQRWVHTHSVEPVGAVSALVDEIEYDLPMEPVGGLVAGNFVRHELERAFRYRHEVIAADLRRHRRFASSGSWRIGVTGSSGFVGAALAPYLSTAGHRIARFVRTPGSERSDDIYWSPEHRQLNPSTLEGLDAIVHLAGESIAQRWTSARRQRIRQSRLDGTRLLVRTIEAMKRPPRVMVCASAIGYYGNRGDELLDETSSRGEGFLAQLVEDWEEESRPLRERGVRVVHARFGVLLSPAGGALQRLLFPFRAGVGGRVGSGEQWMSWIALDDCLGAIEHALFTESVSGVVNVVSPEPVRNAEFTRTLSQVLHRPAILPVPGFALRAVFGDMADETLLASQRVEPVRLRESGFSWRHASLERALRFELGRAPT